MLLLTIFTPVYNRAYLITKLYDSLCRQSCCDFEWIIVDDGSTDDIESKINEFIAEAKISIRFFKQPNGGKHRAINRGVREARGEFFFIVDSDDYLTDDAVKWVKDTAELIRYNNDFAGLSGIRVSSSGNKIGGGNDFGNIDANAIDIRLRHGVVGDLAEVFKTDILRQYPFPEFEDEKFCPEALVWHRIARHYKMRYCHKGIYVGEYLDDGLTAKIVQLRRSSPRASMLYYSEHFHDSIPIVWKAKAAINFWRFQLVPYCKKYKMLSPLSLMAWFPGKMIALMETRR